MARSRLVEGVRDAGAAIFGLVYLDADDGNRFLRLLQSQCPKEWVSGWVAQTMAGGALLPGNHLSPRTSAGVGIAGDAARVLSGTGWQRPSAPTLARSPVGTNDFS